jgi:hypothetical protein
VKKTDIPSTYRELNSKFTPYTFSPIAALYFLKYNINLFLALFLKMPKEPRSTAIQAFFSPISSTKKRRICDEISTPLTAPWSPKTGSVYRKVKIAEVQPGPRRITFTGRVANYREVEKNNKLATAAKVLLRMALTDSTGAIDVTLSSYLFFVPVKC